jgi:hypothetical protein
MIANMIFHVLQMEHKHFDDHSDDITKLLSCCNHANSNLRLNKLTVSVTTLVISVYLSDFEIKSFSKLYFTYRRTTAILNLGYLYPWGVRKQFAGGMRNLKSYQKSPQKENKKFFSGVIEECQF